MDADYTACPLNKHFVIAVDESENSRRTLAYVSYVLGGLPEVRATLLNIVFVPPEDFFEKDEDRLEWIAAHEEVTRKMLDTYRQIMVKSGFGEETVAVKVRVGDCPSVAECIFKEARELGAGTVVVGRRGKSKKEEFILGSTSNRMLHIPKQCAALWVVE
ncbi:MAG: universal stress protein [Candidatus Sulfobium sp.]|jgi:nucleotide-binding universal stress UspA family protein